MNNQIVNLSAVELNQLILKKDLSLNEVAQAFLNQYKKYDSKIGAWVYLDEQKIFDQINRLGSKFSYEDSLLYGIPFGIKDIYFSREMPTKMGSELLVDFYPKHNSTLLEKLQNFGAILMGKTVTTEFAMNEPTNVINPWNKEYTPGGSSTGSAVAVAMRMCPIAFGTQTAGSILRPASYNGIIGFKPSLGIFSTEGIFPVSPTFDTVGWMSRNLEDIAMILDVLSKENSTRLGFSYDNKKETILERVKNFEEEKPKIGVVAAFFERESSLEVQANMFEVTEKLSNFGARIEIFKLPNSFIGINEARKIIEYSEAYTFHKNFFDDLINSYKSNTKNRINSGKSITEADYLRSLKLVSQFRKDIKKSLENFDVIIMPTNNDLVPKDKGTTGDPKFQSPWTAAGLPSISIPSGTDRNRMPLGLQIVGNYLDDYKLLRITNWIKNVINIKMGFPTIINE